MILLRKAEYYTNVCGGAIILIVLWHLNSVFQNCLPAFGDRGVEFFFLISGLLIGIKYYDSNKMKTLVNITVQMYPCSEGTDTDSPAL